MRQDVYSGTLRHYGEEHEEAIFEALNYATDLFDLRRFEEAESLLRRWIPVARRVLGESHEITLKMRTLYAMVLYKDADATLDDLREAVTTFEDAERTARRVLGGVHPLTATMEDDLRKAREILRACEGSEVGSVKSVCEAIGAMTAGDV